MPPKKKELTIREMQEKLDELSIVYELKKLRQYYVNLLAEVDLPKVDLQDQKDINIKVSVPKVLSLRLFQRLLIIVQDTEEQERDMDCYGHPGNKKQLQTCNNFAFEKSTGVSNKYNFKTVWLPILRQDADTWLHKDGGLGSLFNSHLLSTLIKYIQGKLCEKKDRCFVEIALFLKEFLSRFGCWRQLQISAALSKKDELWNIIPTCIVLKDFVLNYNWCEPLDIDLNLDAENKIKNILKSNPELNVDIKELTNLIGKGKGTPVISTLRQLKIYVENSKGIQENIDFIKKLDESGRLFEGKNTSARRGFFYKQLNTMGSILYNLEDYVDCKDVGKCSATVNKWLSDNKALCKDQNALVKNKEDTSIKTSIQVVDKQKDDEKEKFSGWFF